MARPVRHHVFPQEHRKWFEARGFTGDMDIDNFTIELDEAAHQALHGGGDWRLGRTWSGEWNQRVMFELQDREEDLGRLLKPSEIIAIVRELMGKASIDRPFLPYKGR